MRILTTILAATLLASPLLPPALAKDVSVEFFYETLDPYGDWIQTADYGYVWHPKEAEEGWRPYTVGNWAYTDAGWTWVSEEPYGAITYHYGRWTRLQDTGWVWVPDTEWAPAWVSWRRSDQYVGWAPLPPEATFQREVGISSWADSYYDIGPTQYTFVAARDFGAPKLSTVILPRKQNVGIIRETRNITNITYSDRGIYNDGPQYDIIVRDSRTPVRRLRLERRDDVEFDGPRVRGDGLRTSVVGDALRVFAPAVGFRTEVAPTRVVRRVERPEVDRGWRDVPQSQDLRTHYQQDSPRPPAALPPRPSFARAAAALGLGATDDRSKRNLDAEGRPRGNREFDPRKDGRPGESARNPVTTVAPETRPMDRLRDAAENALRPGETAPNNRKPATAETRPRDPQDRPPKPETAVRPADERPSGVPRPERVEREGARPEGPRAGKGGPPANTTDVPRENDRPASGAVRPEGAGDRPPKSGAARPEGMRKPEGRPEPKATIPSPADAPRTRPEGAPDAPRRAEGAAAVRPGTAVPRPGAVPPPAGTTTAPTKGKKGDADSEKDKDKKEKEKSR